MDETSLSELLECSVCLEQLDDSSKVLPCQHTFCRRCLHEILATKKELRCPECRTLIEIAIDDLPTNILLVRILEGMRHAKSSGSAQNSPIHRYRGTTGPAKKAWSHPCVKALFSYEPKEQGDLRFNKGEIVLLRKQVDENWFFGSIGERAGFFPVSYVKVLKPLPKGVPQCRALYDFTVNDENEKDCISFKKDDMLTVIRRVDDNWIEGKLHDRVGIFPLSFVDLNDTAMWLLQRDELPPLSDTQGWVERSGVPCPPPGSSSSSSGSDRSPEEGAGTAPAHATRHVISPRNGGVTVPTHAGVITNPALAAAQRLAAQKRHSLGVINRSHLKHHPHRHSVELPVSSAVDDLPLTSQLVRPVPAVPVTSPPHSQGNGVANASHAIRIFSALYNYTPQKDDEIGLTKGDYYTVTEKCHDGWFKGACLRTGVIGVFPGNYVQTVRLPAVQSPTETQHHVSAVQQQPASQNVQHRRNKAFPKTSLIGSGSITNSPAGRAVTYSKVITNVTQAQTRCIMSSCRTAQSSPAAADLSASSAHSPVVSRHAGGRAISSPSSDRPRRSPRTRRSHQVHSRAASGGGVNPAATAGVTSCRRTSLPCAVGDTAVRPPPNVVVPCEAGGATGGGGGTTAADATEKQVHRRDRKERKKSLLDKLAKKRTKDVDNRSQETDENSGSRMPTIVVSTSESVGNRKSVALAGKKTSCTRYRCVTAFPPQDDEDLELKVGDVVHVNSVLADGWMSGTVLTTGETGLFPANFVEKL